MKMTIDSADEWCNNNSSCHGFTFKTNASGETDIYFRDETQIFFMDSQLQSLARPLGQSQWTSHVSQERAPPLSKPHCATSVSVDSDNTPGDTSCTSGIQIWVKDLSSPHNNDSAQANTETNHVALALLLVNHGDEMLREYTLDVTKLPNYFVRAADIGGKVELSVRDVWAQKTLPLRFGGAASAPLRFKDVAPHDSVFWVLRPVVQQPEGPL